MKDWGSPPPWPAPGSFVGSFWMRRCQSQLNRTCRHDTSRPSTKSKRMRETLTVRVNGNPVSVPGGATAAVAVLLSSEVCRASVLGTPRSAFCGMGTCFECRVEINGQPQLRSCQILCEAGMEIKTGE